MYDYVYICTCNSSNHMSAYVVHIIYKYVANIHLYVECMYVVVWYIIPVYTIMWFKIYLCMSAEARQDSVHVNTVSDGN